MNGCMLSLRIARRYLLSRNSHSVVNAISWVSAVAVAVPVVAMVLILSLHNGLSRYIEQMYSDFDSQAQVRVTAGGGDGAASGVGAYFVEDSAFLRSLAAVQGVRAVAPVLEQNVLVMGDDDSFQVATLRGVDSTYSEVVPLGDRVEWGVFNLDTTYRYNLLLGRGVAYNLGFQPGAGQDVEVFALTPRGDTRSLFDMGGYNSIVMHPNGIYALDQQTDSRFIFAELELCRQLFGMRGMLSSVEIALEPGVEFDDFKGRVGTVLARYSAGRGDFGQEYSVLSRREQKMTMYRVVEAEKLMIYGLLVMVLLLAAMSLVGQTLMLVVEKRRDLLSLRAMGAGVGVVRGVFVWQGMLVVAVGCAGGVAVGLGLCAVQAQWGLISMAGESFAMHAYPILVLWSDVLGIVGTVLVLPLVVLWGIVCVIIRKK